MDDKTKRYYQERLKKSQDAAAAKAYLISYLTSLQTDAITKLSKVHIDEQTLHYNQLLLAVASKMEYDLHNDIGMGEEARRKLLEIDSEDNDESV